MSAWIIAVIVGLMGMALLLIVLRRVVRLAIRLALVGVILVALLTGAGVWWWHNGSGGASVPPPARESHTGTPRRGSSR